MQRQQELVSGFSKGFDIRYHGSYDRRHTSENLPLNIGTKTELWNKVTKEVKEGRYAGPFEWPPCPNYIQSPLGLVPKSGGKTRFIFHLSYDFGKDQSQLSINALTPQELCTVKYNDLEHAVQNCLNLLKSEESPVVLAFSKTDVSSAFHLVPVLVFQRCLLIMMAIHPITKVKWYFVDKCLPFGSSRSCKIFQMFSDALAFAIKYRLTQRQICRNPALTNYLDDFLFIALRIAICNQMLKQFLQMCQYIGCPMSEDKTDWASPVITFLGTLLDGRRKLLSIPIEKIIKAGNLLQYAIDKKKVTIKFVQQLTGMLNFLHKCVVPGRAFMRGMYSKLKIRDNKGQLLKQHHHMYLNGAFVVDCRVWLTFLMNAQNAQLCRHFRDFDNSIAPQVLQFYSDASLNQN